MSYFRKYDKIHRFGKEETDGILEGVCHIEEKIDGANTSVWLENGEIQCGSRNRHLKGDDFNGFVSYINSLESLKEYLHENPTHILYGEWLVRHTINYTEDAYKKWYLFDIYETNQYETEDPGYENHAYVRYVGKSYDIDMPWYIGRYESPSIDDLKKWVGQSAIAPKGEGIVIKNDAFINKFGDRVCAKLVTDNFMEANAITFGGNNKNAENYQELYFVHKYMTDARLKKIIQKLQPKINEKLDLKHIPRICNTAYHDMITEEAWEIAKAKKTVDFKQLERLAFNKAKALYMKELEL